MILMFSVIIAIIVMICIIHYNNKKIDKEKSKISIKESLDLAQVPVVTFMEGDIKLNFLLDSGSSHSHICKGIVNSLIGTPINTDYTFTTATGEGNNSAKIDSVLTYKDKEFKISLFVNETLDASFDSIKKECGVQIHGILGADFLKEHKYILDFVELVAYPK